MDIKNWTLHYEGFEPLPCQAPCTMYGVLYDQGKIPDPFHGLNERTLRHLAGRDCAFTAVFAVEEDMLARDYVELAFRGLDTICRITLNGAVLGRVKNMHREYVYDVKGLLRSGDNELRLDFQSPTRYFARRQQRRYMYMNDGDTLPGAAHLRKAFYQSGWDWGPTLPDMGIFRPVELRAYDTDRIDRVAVRQYHRDGVVEVEVTAATRRNAPCELYAVMDGQRIRLEHGVGRVTIDRPRLWWVRGYGEQNLYDLDVELLAHGRVIDVCHREIGLRTLTVSTQTDPDGKGSEFCFVINGVKIFAMGANFVPMDNLLGRITRERWEALIRQALDANFNTLRVWGGGYYPDDEFYELCDRHGILVWQDFMVACANICLTEEMAEEFREEAVCNLRRLRHHPSLGLLCGNNEMEEGILSGWGGDDALVRQDYLRLYEHLLPELCDQYAPDTFYWPSSPSSGGGFNRPGDHARGDTHYWEVWHGGVPFTTYRQKSFRFCSEYGFESFPSMKTIRAFCGEEDLNCFSRVMENHQKCRGGNGKILRYLADNYLYPSAFENLVYASQLLQAEAIRYGVEHFRRQRGYCMGSIYWQFNDCWPVASWSSVDSLGRYKALHYAARKFYAPVAMGLFLEGDRLTVNVSNETRQEFRGSVRLTVCKNDLRALEERRVEAAVDSLSSADVTVWRVDVPDRYDSYLCAELYDGSGALLARRVELLVPPKHFTWLRPDIQAEFTDGAEGVDITFRSDVFAQGVYLDFEDFDCVLSDNFFSLTGPEPYRITARTVRRAEELRKSAVIKSVYDIR